MIICLIASWIHMINQNWLKHGKIWYSFERRKFLEVENERCEKYIFWNLRKKKKSTTSNQTTILRWKIMYFKNSAARKYFWKSNIFRNFLMKPSHVFFSVTMFWARSKMNILALRSSKLVQVILGFVQKRLSSCLPMFQAEQIIA